MRFAISDETAHYEHEVFSAQGPLMANESGFRDPFARRVPPQEALMFPRKIFFLAFFVFLAVSVTQAQEQKLWQALAPFPGPIREAAIVAADQKVYMFAGQGTGYVPLGLVYEYDPSKDIWTEKKRMPLPSHHNAITEYNGKIYLFGGFKLPETGQFGWEPIDNSWQYDPKTDTWKALKASPSKRGAGSAAVVNGKAYVMGGLAVHPGTENAPVNIGTDDTPRRSVTTVEEYDFASDSWRVRTPMPTPRHHFVVAAVNGKIYALGGRQGLARNSVGYTDAVEEYDPATDMWGPPRTRMPLARQDMSFGVYNDRLFVIGGGFRSAFNSFESVRAMDVYEPATNQWYALPSVPAGRDPTTAAVIGATLYLLSNDRIERRPAGGGESQPFPFDAVRLSNFFK
jgi:N-acetylneuraminic acid mutarotase